MESVDLLRSLPPVAQVIVLVLVLLMLLRKWGLPTRSVEKKYFDKTYQSNSTEVLTGQTVPLINNGVTYISNVWGDYAFGTTVDCCLSRHCQQ